MLLGGWVDLGMVKRLPLLLFIGLAWGQGIVDEFEGTYGIVGWQISELKSPLTLDYIQKGFDSEYDYSNYPDTLESVSFNGGKPGLIIGFGYQWINYKTEYWDIGNPIMMLYTKLSGNSFDYPPLPNNLNEYHLYKNNMIAFIKARNQRMLNSISSKKESN